MTTKKLIILATMYTFFMWSLGWVSVRIYDSRKPTSSMVDPVTTASMLEMINEERKKVGVGPVYFNDKAAVAAELKACDMNTKNYFDHRDPNGRWGWHFLIESGVNYNNAGENLAKDAFYPDDAADMRGFMESPTHRSIIVDPKYVSVGYASCGVYTVQYFVN